MKEYIVYFEMFGRRMKTTVYADNPAIAKKVIEHKIIYHKIEEVNNQPQKEDDVIGWFNDILNGNKC